MTRTIAWSVATTILASCSTATQLVPDASAGRPANSRPGKWRELPPTPEGVNPWSTTVWIGKELVVWGNPGAIYNPEEDEWRKLPAPPEGRGVGGGPVWTSSEVLSWSTVRRPYGKPRNEGLGYNPSSNEWRVLPRAPISGRIGHEAVWTGEEMIVWGGMEQCCAIDSTIHGPEAAAFNPATNEWRSLEPAPKRVSGDGSTAHTIAVGDRMLVWRGGRLSAFDLGQGEWVGLSDPEFPRERCGMTGGPASAADESGGPLFTWTGACDTKYGRIYDIKSDRWREIADSPMDIWSLDATKDVVYASGRTDPMVDRSSIWRYDVATDRWAELPKPPKPLAAGTQVRWTGSEVLVWGGQLAKGVPPSGAAFTPE